MHLFCLRTTMIFLIILSYFSASCSKSEGRKAPAESPEICLAKEQIFINGRCVNGAGLKGNISRFSLLPEAPFFAISAKEQITICVLHEESSFSRIDQIEQDTAKAVQVWLEEISDLTPRTAPMINFDRRVIVPSDVEFSENLPKLCKDGSDASVVVLQTLNPGTEDQNRAFAFSAQKSIWLHNGSRYAVILHEVGHLFGLGDVYVEDYWNCRPGFPNSVMCEHDWAQPLFADREAIRRNYCLYSNGANPTCFNHVKDSILSFLPEEVPTERGPRQGSYFSCSSGNEQLSYSAYRLSLEGSGSSFLDFPQPGYLYSTDSQSVGEVYSEDRADFEFSIQDLEADPRNLSPIKVNLTLFPDSMQMKTSKGGRFYDKIFKSCTFSGRFLDFVKSKGFKKLKHFYEFEFNELSSKAENNIDYQNPIDPDQFRIQFLSDDLDLSSAVVKVFLKSDTSAPIFQGLFRELDGLRNGDDGKATFSLQGKGLPMGPVYVVIVQGLQVPAMISVTFEKW